MKEDAEQIKEGLRQNYQEMSEDSLSEGGFPVSEWVYLHPPRDNFAATMTDEEAAAFKRHSNG